MKSKKSVLTAIALAGLTLSSCYWHNWDTIHIGTGPAIPTACTVNADSVVYNSVTIERKAGIVDTGTIMSYSLDIQPIVASMCATNTSCHGAGAAGLAKDYSTYAGVHSDCRGDTTASTFFSYISPGASDPMPKSGPKLTYCQRLKLKNWIHQGAQNN